MMHFEQNYMESTSKDPIVRIDSIYQQKRQDNLIKAINEARKNQKRAVILITRKDRVIKNISKEMDVPIYHGANPSDYPGECDILFHMPIDRLECDYKECGHPDCCIPERKKEHHKMCSQCKSIHYCSIVCQKDHWKKHGPHCKMIAIQKHLNSSPKSARFTLKDLESKVPEYNFKSLKVSEKQTI